jgi:hypothetical protein
MYIIVFMLKKQFYIKSWHSFRYSSGYWSLITDYYLDYKLGGLGLHASERLYWAAWADALPVLAARLPQLAERCVAALGDDSPVPCLREAAQSGSFLERQGWQSRPPWDTLTHLPRPPPTLAEREPGLPAHTSRLSSFKLLFASASCCLPCPRQPEPCSVPRLDPTPERG